LRQSGQFSDLKMCSCTKWRMASFRQNVANPTTENILVAQKSRCAFDLKLKSTMIISSFNCQKSCART
jgi:hypothetical protein